MGYFLARSWGWWLLATLLAMVIAWFLGRRLWPHQHSCDHEAAVFAARLTVVENDRLLTAHDGGAAAGARSDRDEQERLRARLAQLEGPQGILVGLRAQVADLEGRLSETRFSAARAASAIGVDAGGAAVTDEADRADEADATDASPQVASPASRVSPEVETALAPGVVALAADGGEGPTTEAPAAIGGRVRADDLTDVDGVGPVISGLLVRNGITTWAGLAATPVHRLQEMLAEAGPRYQVHDPSSWPAQAALLGGGRWAAFRSLTDGLHDGRDLDGMLAEGDGSAGDRLDRGRVD